MLYEVITEHMRVNDPAILDRYLTTAAIQRLGR